MSYTPAVDTSITMKSLFCLLFRSTTFSSRSMCTSSWFSNATESVPLCLSDTNRSCAGVKASVCRPAPSHRQIGLALYRLPCIRRFSLCGYLIKSKSSSRPRKATEPKQPRFVTQRRQTRNVIPHRLRGERSMLVAGWTAPPSTFGCEQKLEIDPAALTPQRVPSPCEV